VLEINIPWFTVYALSTENLNRPAEELDVLFDLYVEGLRDIADDPRIHDNRVRVHIIGRRELLPPRVNDAIDYAEKKRRITTISCSPFAWPTAAEKR